MSDEEKVLELEKENARLSKMLEMTLDIIGDFLLSYETYPVMLDWNITKEDRNTIYAELEKRVENEK